MLVRRQAQASMQNAEKKSFWLGQSRPEASRRIVNQAKSLGGVTFPTSLAFVRAGLMVPGAAVLRRCETSV